MKRQIKNLNCSVDPSRIQQGDRQPYFVNWRDDLEVNHYEWFQFPFMMYDMYERLNLGESVLLSNGEMYNE